MTIESVIGIISGILAIAGALIWVNDKLKKLSLAKLMDKLIDTKYSSKRHRRVLKIMNLKLGKCMIKKDYIDNFILNDRKKEEVFKDICEQNNIEPTETICTKFMGYDMKMFRKEYNSKRRQTNIPDATICTEEKQSAYISSLDNDGQTVYMSGLLMDRHPETCKKLISILEKHNVNYSFIQGTKDIWCRDYMPVQTQSGKFIQFKYDPSYLKGKKEWEDSRSDKKEILEKNDWMQKLNIKESDINLDGGNVLICDGRAILSDRIFTENPKCDKESLKKELSELLECKDIIIIPALKSQYEDFTGHADGMVRFVDRNTIIGNERRPDEYQYMKDGLQKAIDTFNLTYIDVPYFEDKDPNHPDSAIGIYVNYLEVNNLIVLPVFGREEDDQVRDIFRKTFPNKQIETIDYNEVAKEGGLLNCTTWVVKCK